MRRKCRNGWFGVEVDYDRRGDNKREHGVRVGMMGVAAARLRGVCVADPVVIMLVMPEMLTVLGVVIHAVAYHGGRGVGGIDRNDQC